MLKMVRRDEGIFVWGESEVEENRIVNSEELRSLLELARKNGEVFSEGTRLLGCDAHPDELTWELDTKEELEFEAVAGPDGLFTVTGIYDLWDENSTSTSGGISVGMVF